VRCTTHGARALRDHGRQARRRPRHRRRDLVDPSVADVAVDGFERIYRSAGARLAFLSGARSIYLDPPFGRDGLFPRMAALEPPALFV
jgi:hypothetical protein